MKVNLLLLIFLTCLGIVRAQMKSDNLSIKIVITTASIQQGEFVTTIDKAGNDLKIVYSFRDSIAKAYYKDERYLTLLHSVKQFNQTKPSENPDIFRALDSLKKEYSYYSKDSLSLRADTIVSFISLLEKIAATPKEELENPEVSKKQSSLDGAYYSFTIAADKEIKYVYAISPVLETHPLLAQLTTEVLNIYKKEKQNNFLDKMSTLSY